jgi:Na+-driven multidrug efflux pump
MWLYGFWDATKAMTMMILRGTGRPQITVLGNFISCAVFAYPLAFTLAATIDFPLWALWYATPYYYSLLLLEIGDAYNLPQ